MFLPLLIALLRATALLIALLIPSSELGLIKPAASPMRKTPFLPVQKLNGEEGRKTIQASVLIGFFRIKPNRSSFFFCVSKRLRQFSGSKAPPKIT